MKNFITSVYCFSLFLCVSFSASSQITLTVTPETPLTYLAYEITMPTIKAGYTSRTQYFGSKPFVIQIGLIVQKKYADLPLYDRFSETTDFIDTIESQTIVSRTANYVAYTVQVRKAAPEDFVTYARDTFFLSGTTITSISETIYDTESVSGAIETYAEYDVVYHTNGKIERIKLKDTFDGNRLNFAGVSVIYNANNTIKSDSLYRFNYSFNAGMAISNVSIYEDHTYKSNNALILDTTFYNQIGSNPLLNAKYTYTLNPNNEIIEIQGLTYSSKENKFKQTYYYNFDIDPSLDIISKTAATSIAIYPNPVIDLITIPASCNYISWNITSIDGASIDKGSNSSNKIATDHLKQGLYMLTLTNKDQTWIVKFVK